MNEHLDPTNEHFSNTEREIEKKLRPLSFDDFTGQAAVLENLKIFVEADKTYKSLYHWKNNIDNDDKVVDNADYWEELDYFYIYEQDRA